jgi:hypothetical protein
MGVLTTVLLSAASIGVGVFGQQKQRAAQKQSLRLQQDIRAEEQRQARLRKEEKDIAFRRAKRRSLAERRTKESSARNVFASAAPGVGGSQEDAFASQFSAQFGAEQGRINTAQTISSSLFESGERVSEITGLVSQSKAEAAEGGQLTELGLTGLKNVKAIDANLADVRGKFFDGS